MQLWMPLRTLVVLPLIIAAFPAHAIVLYRGDERPPSVVFEAGFLPSGTNDNPIDHISGTSCFSPHSPPSQRSAYVALTTQESDALLYANYVYHVTPDQMAPDATATFDVVSGLRFVSSRRDTYGLTLRQASAVDNMLAFHASQGQHMSRRIPREWIRAVDIYEWDSAAGRPTLVQTEWNPHYRQPTRSGSQPMFSPGMVAGIQRAVPPPQVVYADGPNGSTVSVCMSTSSADACGPSSMPRSGALRSPPLHCAAEPMYPPGTPYFNALLLLLGD